MIYDRLKISAIGNGGQARALIEGFEDEATRLSFQYLAEKMDAEAAAASEKADRLAQVELTIASEGGVPRVPAEAPFRIADEFQKIVSAVLAGQAGEVGTRGTLASSGLQLVGSAYGSLGFSFAEIEPDGPTQTDLFGEGGSPLRQATQQAADLLEQAEAIEGDDWPTDLSQRAFSHIAALFKAAAKAQVGFNITANGGRRRSLSRETVIAVRAALEEVAVGEVEEGRRGRLFVLPAAGTFELRAGTDVLSGTLHTSADPVRLGSMSNQDVAARLLIRTRTSARGVSTKLLLLNADLAAEADAVTEEPAPV